MRSIVAAGAILFAASASSATSVVVRQKGKWLIAALRVFPAQRL